MGLIFPEGGYLWTPFGIPVRFVCPVGHSNYFPRGKKTLRAIVSRAVPPPPPRIYDHVYTCAECRRQRKASKYVLD